MKKILFLLPLLSLSACITVYRDAKRQAANTPAQLQMKAPTETVDFVDPADGQTYKWVKVRVFNPMIYSDRMIGKLAPEPVIKLAPTPQPPVTTPLPVMKFTPKTGSFKDARDGQVYRTVTIGKQTWMAQNLNFKTQDGAYYYNDDTANGPVYGLLYRFNVLPEACPKGWHIPTDAEWEELETNAGMPGDEINRGMFRGSIAPDFIGDGATKMNVVFGGRGGPGRYKGLGDEADYWTSTREGNPITSRIFRKDDNRIGKNHTGEAYCFSVRCVKDTEAVLSK